MSEQQKEAERLDKLKAIWDKFDYEAEVSKCVKVEKRPEGAIVVVLEVDFEKGFIEKVSQEIRINKEYKVYMSFFELDLDERLRGLAENWAKFSATKQYPFLSGFAKAYAKKTDLGQYGRNTVYEVVVVG